MASKASFTTLFGVELEFLLVVEHPELPDTHHHANDLDIGSRQERRREIALLRHKLEVNARGRLADALRAASLENPTKRIDDLWGHPDRTSWVIKPESTVKPSFKQRVIHLRLANGSVLEDLSTTGHVFISMEVTSPALPLNSPASFQELAKALAVIKSFKTFVNETCGLHVHVSRGDKMEGYDLRTLKNFSLLTFLAQRQLCQLVGPRERLSNKYCRLPLTLFKHDKQSPQAIKSTVDRYENRFDLIQQFLGVERMLAFNFTNLRKKMGVGKQKLTIEFRSHEGSLDADTIERWVMTAGSLIDKCSTINDAWFRNLDEKTRDPGYTAIDLLTDLGLEDLADRWSGHTYSWTDKDVQEILDAYDRHLNCASAVGPRQQEFPASAVRDEPRQVQQ